MKRSWCRDDVNDAGFLKALRYPVCCHQSDLIELRRAGAILKRCDHDPLCNEKVG